MDLMKDVDKLAKEYTPPVEEKVEDSGTYRMMKSALTEPKDIKPSDKLDLSKKKKKTLKAKLKETREQNGWV